MNRPRQIPHILLVDDEPRFLHSLQNILEHYGYKCTLAQNGSKAIELLKSGSFDLALLDVQLPDMSGCDIAGFMQESCQDTTAIMLTGMSTVETAVKAMKLGAYDFLNKPINHEILLKTLQQALQHNQLRYELDNSEQKFQVLAESAWEGIAIHEDGHVIEANSQFFEIFGYDSHTELANELNLKDLLASTSQNETSVFAKCDEGSRLTTGLRKDGTALPIETKSRCIQHQGKKRQVWVVRDLTERRKAEEEKFDLQKKLAAANKLNALGLMAGSVAHDLNNILTGVVSYPDLLLSQMDDTNPHYTQIKKIQAAGKRAAAVVSDLVAITRGRIQHKEVANLNNLILTYLDSLEHEERLATFPRVTIQTTLHKELNNCCCSPQHIHKLFLNLVGNAMEAVESDGVVRISTENCIFIHPLHADQKFGNGNGNSHIKLVIEDNGPGIKDSDIDHIFDPFYSTKVMGQSGTGLGLSVVWNIVQDHGGWVEVKNGSPGARFEVYLPATKDDICPVKPLSKNELQRGLGEKILIIDDVADQNEIFENALSRLGYKTFSVTSGEEGIAFLRSQSVDLILLDMVMGEGLNGRETLELIRKNLPNLPVIIISGFATPEEIAKTKQLGISFFLEKPITLPKLSTAIHESLATPSA